jgi:uncharacterized protein involved in type VI secretion and phage assembly
MTLFESMNPTLKELARATVVSNKDPDKKGRVQVEYPWIGKASSKVPSEWARLCLPFASKDSGFWMLPEVGDEVLVYFDNGNLESPIIMGTLYSEKNKVPLSNRDGDLNSDDKNNLKFIKTKSGHMLCFDDSNDEGAIILKDRDGRSFEINSGEKNILIKDVSGHEIIINEKELLIKNKEGSKITIQGSKISIEASASIELGEGATEALVKGTSFMALFNAHTHTVGPSTSSPPVSPMQPSLLSQKVKTK